MSRKAAASIKRVEDILFRIRNGWDRGHSSIIGKRWSRMANFFGYRPKTFQMLRFGVILCSKLTILVCEGFGGAIQTKN